jgi:cytochrome c peroxidase
MWYLLKRVLSALKGSFWLILVSWACAEDAVPITDDHSLFRHPDHFPNSVYAFENNEITLNRTTLGRHLFFDPVLSKDSVLSCESCHHQWAAFSDPAHPLSHGIENRFGFRNSPALMNLAWHPIFMHDGGIIHFENMPIAPITDTNEMGSKLSDVMIKLNNSSFYKSAFKRAYGTDSIETQFVMKALVQYMSALVSDGSRYDDYLRGNLSALSNQELSGLALFRSNCESCHQEPLFSDFSFRNNGLATQYADEGRQRISLQPEDKGKFKVPSLRNIELTHPYMHDGSIDRLEEVVEHYSKGIEAHDNLDDELPVGGFQFNQTEKEALIAFLKSLTDENFTKDPKLGNPW